LSDIFSFNNSESGTLGAFGKGIEYKFGAL